MKKANSNGFSVNITDSYFEAVARQRLPFDGTGCELIDNSLSNAGAGQAIILISLDPVKGSPDLIRLTVADWGIGMTAKGLINALQFGSVHKKEGYLCIYGIGLCNAILVATQHRYPWCIVTKTKKESSYHLVKGPFKTRMEMDTVDSIPEPLASIITSDKVARFGAPSTIVSVVTDKRVASTMLSPRGNCAPSRVRSLNLLRRAFIEHIGVKYRGFLTPDEYNETPAQIIVTNYTGNDGKCKDVSVPPIYPPFAVRNEKHFVVKVGKYDIPVDVTYGLLDKARLDSMILGGYEAEYYYQNNLETQGFDIQLGNRTVATSQFESIWGLKPHPAFNAWTGIVRVDVEGAKLPRGFLNTLSNKSDIDVNDPGWQAIFDAIRADTDMKPRESENNNLAGYREKMAVKLRLENSDHDVETFHPIYANRAKIDIVDLASDGTCEVYNITAKVGTIAHLNELQLFWNGMIQQGYQPRVGYLVCKKAGPMLQHTCEELNGKVQAMSKEHLIACLDQGGVDAVPTYNFKVVVDPDMPTD